MASSESRTVIGVGSNSILRVHHFVFFFVTHGEEESLSGVVIDVWTRISPGQRSISSDDLSILGFGENDGIGFAIAKPVEFMSWEMVFSSSIQKLKLSHSFSKPFLNLLCLVDKVGLQLCILLSGNLFELIENLIEVFLSSAPKFHYTFLSGQPLMLNSDIGYNFSSQLSSDFVWNSIIDHDHELGLMLRKAEHFCLVPNLLFIFR